MSNEISLDAPNVGVLEKRYLNRAIDTGFVSTVGPFVPDFEERFAAYLGVKRAVATQSGTAALHISLYELGIGPGDEVIVPALTFVATANPVRYLGANPVFVDVDPETWNIDPAEVEKNITKRTKAVIPVHFYGNPCNMREIMRIARKYSLYVVEDATESLGAKYKGRYTGTFGDLNCFSFNGNKVITTGGGGMVVGVDAKKLKHIKCLVNQARGRLKDYLHGEIGFNYRMTNIEAALGVAQMEKLGMFLDKKRRINELYKKGLEGIDSIVFQKEYNNAESSWWFTSVIINGSGDIASLQKRLKRKGVPTRRIFAPLPQLPMYRSLAKGRHRNSGNIYERGLCLPSSTLNSDSDIWTVCSVIREVLGGR
jgi:perosamine synthetase